jgi:hypothetical protein
MKDLTLNQNLNNVGVITLKEITDLISVEHNKAMKTVERLSLENSFGTLEKIATVYNEKGQTIPTYNLTKKQAIAVGAKLNNSLLMKVIDRLEELENINKRPLTISEQIILIAQGHQEVNQRLTEIEHKIENDITLTSAQKYHLKQLVSKRAYELKETHKLEDSFMSKVFARFYKKLKKHFIVSSYMEIPKSKFDEAIEIIKNVSLGDLI